MSSVQELVKEIQKLSKEYYYEGSSSVPDEYFDKLVKDLTDIDPDNIILHQVNYGVGSSRDKKSHKYQILGLPKKYEVANYTGLTTMTPKLDGISVVVYYEKGTLINVLTRGDGYKGIDITSKVLNHVPNKLQVISSDPHTDTIEFTGALRGELIIKNSTFREYLSTSYKNSRNCVAGLANAIDSDLSLADIIFYDMYTDAGLVPQREFYRTNFSEDINKVIMIESDHVSNELLKLQYSSYKNLYDYTLDGVVVESSGEKYAFKENSLGVSSRVIGIEWNSSGYGKLVPVVLIDPVDVSGVTISRVSGNSYNYLLKNMIMIGSYVKVIRSGEVIPYITEVINHDPFSTSNLGINFNYYEKGAHIYKEIHEYNEFHYSLVRLINRAKIKGIGDKLSNQFADMIIDSLDITNLDIYDVMSTTINLDTSRSSLSPNEKKLFDELVNYRFKVMDYLLSSSEEGVGEATIMKLLSNESSKFSVMRYKLVRLGVEDDTTNDKDINLTVAITGKLSKGRSEVERSYKELGIKIGSKFDILICNDYLSSQSAKITKAKKLGVPIFSEVEFMDYLRSKGVI